MLLSFEDLVMELAEGDEPPDLQRFPLHFTWALPPLPSGPDLLVLATDLAGIGGTDAAARGVGHRLVRVGHRRAPTARWASSRKVEVSLAQVYLGEAELLCDVLDRCLAVSQYLLERAPAWLGSL